MSLMDTIKQVLDEKIDEKEKDILDESEVKYKLDENGEQILDEEGNPIPVDEKDMDDDEDKDKDDMDDKDKKKEKVDVKESLSKIFAKADVSEEIVNDLETLFSAAVDEKVNERNEELLDEFGGGVQVPDGPGLAEKVIHYLGNPDDARRIGGRAKQAVASHLGAADKHAAVIQSLLAGGSEIVL